MENVSGEDDFLLMDTTFLGHARLSLVLGADNQV